MLYGPEKSCWYYKDGKIYLTITDILIWKKYILDVSGKKNKTG